MFGANKAKKQMIYLLKSEIMIWKMVYMFANAYNLVD